MPIAYDNGFATALKGRSADECPYAGHTPGSKLMRDQWMAGMQSGMESIQHHGRPGAMARAAQSVGGNRGRTKVWRVRSRYARNRIQQILAEHDAKMAVDRVGVSHQPPHTVSVGESPTDAMRQTGHRHRQTGVTNYLELLEPSESSKQTRP